MRSQDWCKSPNLKLATKPTIKTFSSPDGQPAPGHDHRPSVGRPFWILTKQKQNIYYKVCYRNVCLGILWNLFCMMIGYFRSLEEHCVRIIKIMDLILGNTHTVAYKSIPWIPNHFLNLSASSHIHIHTNDISLVKRHFMMSHTTWHCCFFFLFLQKLLVTTGPNKLLAHIAYN